MKTSDWALDTETSSEALVKLSILREYVPFRPPFLLVPYPWTTCLNAADCRVFDKVVIVIADIDRQQPERGLLEDRYCKSQIGSFLPHYDKV